MPVFDRAAITGIDLYDIKTNEHYGRAILSVTPSIESALLNIINNSVCPQSVVAPDVTFFPSSSRYVPPGIFIKYPRNVIIHAEFRDANSKLWMPVDIYISADAQARGNILGDKYHFDSVEYTNIAIKDIRFLSQGELSTVQK